MCGVAGIVGRDVDGAGNIQKMTEQLVHRGPDASGYHFGSNVFLGHRRLSIIDLDSRSNQPFYSKDSRWVMVYNGEVYNFRDITRELHANGITLTTTSDTEVILEAFCLWGVGFVHKLVGMFVIVIHDTLTGDVFLFRDRLGKKPLYYSNNDQLLLFASELKSIFAHPSYQAKRKVNRSTISTFLQMGYVPEPETFYEGVFKFPAGHYGIVSKRGMSILPYWKAPHYITTTRGIAENTAFEELKRLLNVSVECRLIADVPIGVFLSGGIDSSLVASVAAKHVKLKTFSIGFSESKYDESIHAERVAKHLGADHTAYKLGYHEAMEMLDKYIEHFDEPFADTSAIPTMLVSRLASREVKVALTGDGGDELFLGYGAYTWADRLSRPLWKAARPFLHGALQHLPSSRWKRIAHLFEKVPVKKRRHIFSQEQYFFSDSELAQIFCKPDDYVDWQYDDMRQLAILSEGERQALFDLQFYLRDDLLVKVDRASMAYGLECRSPLLDQRLVEFSLNLPRQFRKNGSETKYLLKKALYENVPKAYFDRPKWGFSIPLDQWMRNELSHLLDYVSDDKISETGVFRLPYVRDLKKRFEQGDDYLYNRLWVLIVAQRFLLKYG